MMQAQSCGSGGANRKNRKGSRIDRYNIITERIAIYNDIHTLLQCPALDTFSNNTV
jgi:hypothetical protein